MAIELSIERRQGYLRFVLEGKRVLGDFAPEMQAVWLRLAEEAKESGLTLALGISNLTGTARVADIYASAVAACETMKDISVRKVAIAIMGGVAALEENRLAETVASSRGIRVRMFATEADALDWLLKP
jgi:hypothetical protein